MGAYFVGNKEVDKYINDEEEQEIGVSLQIVDLHFVFYGGCGNGHREISFQFEVQQLHLMIMTWLATVFSVWTRGSRQKPAGML